MLIDTTLGWSARSEMARLLEDADRRLVEAEQAAAVARYEAELARFERDRLANRRAVRISTELANTPRRGVTSLPKRMRAAAAPRPAPTLPTPPELAPLPSVPERRPERAVAPQAGQQAPDRARVFPHLRVLHLGAAGRFFRLAPHTPVDPERWRDQLREGADVVLVEPPDEAPGWDPLGGELGALLAAAAELGVPTVRIATGSSMGGPGNPSLDLVEGVGAADTIAPSVDTHVFNPVGWPQQPPDPVVAVLGAEPDEDGRHLLEEFDPPVSLIHPPDLVPPRDLGALRRATSPRALRARLIRAGVVLDHPSWRGDETDVLRNWTAALACGVPVVSVVSEERPVAGEERPPGVIEVDESEAVETVHRLLVDHDLRERHGIVGRRWALTSGSRETRFRELLEHLDVPVPAPLRTTVLLSTHRPGFLERGLDSIARQTRSDVDVSLVLHGEAFDGHDLPGRGGLVSSVVRAPGRWVLGDCLNAALDRAGGELVAKMDDDDHYGPDHLTDLVAAWGYSGADVIGKRVEFVHLADRGITIRRYQAVPERDRPHVGGPTPLASRELLRRHRFLRLPNRVDSTLYERVLADGGRIYGIHSRDFVLERHGSGHAWSMDDDEFVTGAIDQRDGLALGFAASDPDGEG